MSAYFFLIKYFIHTEIIMNHAYIGSFYLRLSDLSTVLRRICLLYGSLKKAAYKWLISNLLKYARFHNTLVKLQTSVLKLCSFNQVLKWMRKMRKMLNKQTKPTQYDEAVVDSCHLAWLAFFLTEILASLFTILHSQENCFSFYFFELSHCK